MFLTMLLLNLTVNNHFTLNVLKTMDFKHLAAQTYILINYHEAFSAQLEINGEYMIYSLMSGSEHAQLNPGVQIELLTGSSADVSQRFLCLHLVSGGSFNS